ncbi:MAG: hypothetical protein Q8K04_00690 [Lutibacter sp.]|nr:hypothetical protein [Lutibacter sp.]
MKNFTFIKKTSSLGSKQLRFNWRQFLVLSLFIVTTVLTSFTLTAQNLPGIAPVQTPIGGFGVDGDAYANTPTPGIGDWFYNATLYPGAGRGLFNPDGTVTDPTRTFFLQDNWIQNTDLTIFTGTNKINHNPSTYTWGPGSSPNKNEIQNAAAHFTYGAPGLGGNANDLWCIFAGDRMVTNGSSYIDFEFLQKTLTMTGTTSGGFTSAGTSGGRTIGDILVTIEFVQGGGAATVVIRKWQAVGAGYEYVVYPNSDFVGKIFMTNNTSVTSVPFDAYGGNTYAVNQWAEGAINLTQVLGIGQDPCYSISTLFIRTRSSGSSDQSELKDFPGAPIQLDLGLIPDAPGVTTGELCGPGAVSFTATGCTETGSVLKWYSSATSTTPLFTGNNYNVEITQTTSYWVSCTNAAGCEGPRTQITRIVNPLPTVAANNTGPYCLGDNISLTATFTAAGTSTSAASWSWTGPDGFTSTMKDPTAFASTALKAGIYTVEVTDNNGCKKTAQTTVVVEPCYEPLCSYTQGYYGNPTGSSCDGESTYTTYGLIEKALDDYLGDVMRIGVVGKSILIAKTSADINKVIEYLPGGKSSYELSAGNISISDMLFKTWYTTTVGKNNTTINNALLAQTITLGLNLGMHNNLGAFALQTGTFATAELLNGCGSTEVVERVCVDGVVYNEYEYYTIMSNIAAAASNVNELFALANRALGNVDGIVGSEDGISLNNIASAVDKINNAFDGCRMFMGYGIEPLECGIVLAKVAVAKEVAVEAEPTFIDSSVDFKVYPVPFEDVINVSYKFEYDTDVTIQVFNLQGGLMYGVVDNRYNNGEVAVKQISLPRTFDQALIVRLTTNKEKLSKTIVAKSSTQR